MMRLEKNLKIKWWGWLYTLLTWEFAHNVLLNEGAGYKMYVEYDHSFIKRQTTEGRVCVFWWEMWVRAERVNRKNVRQDNGQGLTMVVWQVNFLSGNIMGDFFLSSLYFSDCLNSLESHFHYETKFKS